KDFYFMFTLVIGLLLGILTGSKILSWAFVNYSFYTYSFFYGLILFSLLDLKKDIKTFKIVEFLIGTAVVIVPYILSNGLQNVQKASSSNVNYFYLFISGVIAGSSMILPGISGSLMLMLLGFYEQAILTVSKLTQITSAGFTLNDFLFLLILGFGVLFGIGVISKALKILFENAEQSILNFILGLVSGSLYPITPSFHSSGSSSTMLLWIALGSTVVLGIGKINRQ
ncbi:MAG: undecaprenyl phosphate translocase family protein, partial [Fervidobacterium sp.]